MNAKTRVYLRQDIEEAPDANRVDQGSGIEFRNLRLKIDPDGRIYFDISQSETPPEIRIPAHLRPFIELVRVETWVPKLPMHRPGVYRMEGVTVTIHTDSNADHYKTTMAGADLVAMERFLAAIRTGTIAPEQDWTTELTQLTAAGHTLLNPSN
jgi:hypothetical protein